MDRGCFAEVELKGGNIIVQREQPLRALNDMRKGNETESPLVHLSTKRGRQDNDADPFFNSGYEKYYSFFVFGWHLVQVVGAFFFGLYFLL